MLKRIDIRQEMIIERFERRQESVYEEDSLLKPEKNTNIKILSFE
jgi:virulence-associated protein VapD